MLSSWTEAIFSDLNNLVVASVSMPLYQTCHGFTQTEVDAALAEYVLFGERYDVARWYDGFVFDGVARPGIPIRRGRRVRSPAHGRATTRTV